MGYLFLALIVMPLVELAVLIKLGQHIGAGNTVLLVILTGVAGAYLAKYQGIKILWELRNLVSQGVMPGVKMMEGVLVLIGAILLLAPGLISDIIGLLFLLPITRQYFVRWAIRILEYYIRFGRLRIYRF